MNKNYMVKLSFSSVTRNNETEYWTQDTVFVNAKNMSDAVKKVDLVYGSPDTEIRITDLHEVMSYTDADIITEDDILCYKTDSEEKISVLPKCILIGGEAGSGKDYVADKLKKAINDKYPGKRVLITHFADLLKYLLHTYDGWNGEKDVEGRGKLQHLGTDVVRAWDSSYWARRLAEFIYFYKDKYDIVIIPDLRFTNEYYVIQSVYLTKYIYVENDTDDSSLTEEQKKHESENSLRDQYSFFIEPDEIFHNCKNNEYQFNEEMQKTIDKMEVLFA